MYRDRPKIGEEESCLPFLTYEMREGKGRGR